MRPDQRTELLIGLALQRRLQIDAIDGFHQISGRLGRNQQRHCRNSARATRVGRAAICRSDRFDAWVTEKRTTEPSAIRTA